MIAPPVENPVDVFTKSAPASFANWQASTFSSSVNRQVSIITFTSLLPLASTTALISSSTNLRFLDLRAPILITISISSAPLAIASLASKALTAEVDAPKGKPITVQTLTELSLSNSAAVLTQVGLTQTLANSYFLASSIKERICSLLASAFSKVWSI